MMIFKRVGCIERLGMEVGRSRNFKVDMSLFLIIFIRIN